MTTTIAISGKGGSGKTTLAAMIIRLLRSQSQGAILAVDADPNACLAPTLGFEPEETIAEIREQDHDYRATALRQTTDEKLALWFIECLIWSNRQANGRNDLQLPLLDLIQSPAIFPFELTSHIITLRRSTRFEISRQGLDLEMVTPA